MTTDDWEKPLPLIVRVNAPFPAVVLPGERVPTVGCEFAVTIVKGEEADVPPLLLFTPTGLVTETLIVPTLATSEDNIEVVICVSLTNAVVRETPLIFTVEPLTKFVPFTTSVNPGEPATTLDGTSDETVGAGSSTLKDSVFDVPPPGVGLVTDTSTGPTIVIPDDGMAAVNCEALTKIVGSATPPKFTVEAETKLLPFTVSVNDPLPETALTGEMEFMAGTRFPLCDTDGVKSASVL